MKECEFIFCIEHIKDFQENIKKVYARMNKRRRSEEGVLKTRPKNSPHPEILQDDELPFKSILENKGIYSPFVLLINLSYPFKI